MDVHTEGRIEVNPEECTGCGICLTSCKREALAIGPAVIIAGAARPATTCAQSRERSRSTTERRTRLGRCRVARSCMPRRARQKSAAGKRQWMPLRPQALGGAAQAAVSASSVVATPCTTAAMRTPARITSSDTPFSSKTLSCELTHLPQPLMAETTSDHSSKSR
jgi:ferredoxin